MKLQFQQGEQIIYQSQPNKSLLFLWFFYSIVYTIIITIFSMPLLIMLRTTLFEFLFSPLIFIDFFVFVVIFWYHIALRKTYKYHITNERDIFEGGILIKKINSISYHKITDVSITQNIIERIVNIAKLNIHTAGTGTNMPEIQFIGLSEPEIPQTTINNQLRNIHTTNRQQNETNEIY